MKKKSKPAKRSTPAKTKSSSTRAKIAAKRAGAKASSARAKSAKKKSAKKFTAKFATVAEYLARVPEPARSALNQIRAAIREVIPADSTDVISYNIPAFRHNKKILVWYAAFASHCSIFPGAAIIEQFKGELTGYTTAKGTVQFPLDKPMPLKLIKKMTKARVG